MSTAGIMIAAAVVAALGSELYGLEWILTLLVFLLALQGRLILPDWVARWETKASSLAENPRAALLLCACAPVIVRICVLPWVPLPHPYIADEFSNLFLADTLIHGRLANPTHPMWRSFETLHQLMRPTWSSMYFPGPAMFYAAGLFLFRSPWLGLQLSVALFCAAVYWGLRGYFPSRWALLGGLLAGVKFGILSHWSDTYWGGIHAALGGALVLGAIGRMQRKLRWRDGLLMGVGLVLLAYSRPYEGLFLCLPVAVRLGYLTIRRTWSVGEFAGSLALPVLLILLPGLAFLVYYFSHITGSPFVLPYVINKETYGWPLTLPWTDIQWHFHPQIEFREYYLYELTERVNYSDLPHFLGSLFFKGQANWRFYIGPALTLPLFFALSHWRDRRIRFLGFVALVEILVVSFQPHFPHYMAPATLAFLAVTVQGFRHLRQWTRKGRQVGLVLSRALPMILVCVLAGRVAAQAAHIPFQKYAGFASWCCSDPGSSNQQDAASLLPPTRRHLIIVRYRSGHSFMNQYIYNHARLDNARIVWAREMDFEQNRKLLEAFPDRQAWLFEPDRDRGHLKPYRLEEPPKNPLEYDHFAK